MKTKPLDYRKHITSDPLICHGQPCIKGTRIMVSTIVGALGAGTPYEEVPGVSAHNRARHPGMPALCGGTG